MNIPVTPGREYLPYQEKGILAALKYLKNWKAFGFNDDMGLGKTVEAIGVGNALGADRIMVCCPSILAPQWKKELLAWSTSPYGATIVNTKKQDPGYGHLIITQGALADKKAHTLGDITPFPPLPDYDLVILDEYHAFKDPAARRSMSIPPRARGNRGKVLVLSGTMPVSKSTDFWATLYYLFPQLVEEYNYKRFAYQFCRVKFAHRKVYYEGVENEDILNDMIYGSGAFIKRMIEDVRPDLPQPEMKLIVWPKDEYQKYLDIEKPFHRKLIENDATELNRLPINRIATMRKDFSLAKVPRIVDFIHTLLPNGRVFVLAHHRETIDAICEQLAPVKVAKIYGGITAKKRQEYLMNFLEQDTPVLVGNIQACNAGLNLQACSQILFAEADWDWEINRQAIARCRRHGQVKTVKVYFTVVEGSLDARILVRALEKQDDVLKLKGDTQCT